jgi:hypothetical protein
VRNEVEPVIKGLLVVPGKLLAAEPDAILERGAFRRCVGVVVECFEPMEKKRMRLALFVTFEVGRKNRRSSKSRVPVRSSHQRTTKIGQRQFASLCG